jgi:hypothetical protein
MNNVASRSGESTRTLGRRDTDAHGTARKWLSLRSLVDSLGTGANYLRCLISRKASLQLIRDEGARFVSTIDSSRR